jgi:hypothetical protein
LVLGQVISTGDVAAACDALIRTGTVAQARDFIFAIQAIFTSAEDHPNVSAASRENIIEHHGNVDQIERFLAPFIPETTATSTLAQNRGALCSAASLAAILTELPGDDMAEQAGVFRDLILVIPTTPITRRRPRASPIVTMVAGGVILAVVGAATFYYARKGMI